MQRLTFILMALVFLPACTPGDTAATFNVPSGSYPLAFDASINALREMRFPVDRVDAQSGIITTSAKHTAGLATPWDLEQSVPSQEAEDLFSHHSRRVRITFEEARTANAPGESTYPAPLGTRPLVGRVEAVVDRRYFRGWRPSSAAILQSDFAIDTQAGALGQDSQYDVPLTRDERLAARIADRIRRSLLEQSSSP